MFAGEAPSELKMKIFKTLYFKRMNAHGNPWCGLYCGGFFRCALVIL
jgi:hypothetical protein